MVLRRVYPAVRRRVDLPYYEDDPNSMANMSLPPEERNLTPHQVEALDMRRRRGSMLLTLAGMFSVIAVLLTCWVGQDLQYAPGFSRPMTYYFLAACGIVLVTLVTGLYMRRGSPEIH
ncbi:MAG TPA: hypothetical protein VF018_16025 [Acidobacteriaceae bacterium]